MGNSFGISPSLEKQYMTGEVRTKGDDCQVKDAFTVSVFVKKWTVTETHDPSFTIKPLLLLSVYPLTY